jgi:putative YjhG/YagF family dehydratase
MGWEAAAMGGREFLILSTHGGIRAADGTPIALGYHTGHWEVGLLMEAAAREFKASGAIPFAAACTDPCDGRSQGTPAMFDSLAYRNDASTVFRRLIRSLPTRRGVLGVATCDKAMMMALASSHDLPCVLVPGGVTLLPIQGEDAARIQTIGVRYVHGEITLQEAADLGCRACASPGGGCQFLGTAATSQVVGEALGMSLGHSALAPSGHPIWLDMATRSAAALMQLEERGIRMRDILTDAALHNAMATHAAFGGSTNLILHLPAVAHAAGLRRPTAADWTAINRRVPRLVDALPNGPRHHPTVQVFQAGGVPEVMLHLNGRMMPRSVRQCVHEARHAPVDGGPVRGSGPPKSRGVSDCRKVKDQVRRAAERRVRDHRIVERGVGQDVPHADATLFEPHQRSGRAPGHVQPDRMPGRRKRRMPE